MELKKNPKKDLNKNRGLYFVAGLALIMLLTYVALEYKTYDKADYVSQSMNIDEEILEEVPITIQFTPPPPPPPPVAPTIIEIVDDEKIIEETIIETSETDPDAPVLEVEDIEVAEIDEDEPIPFMAIEDVPIFPGCEKEKEKGAEATRACFQKMMNKHISKNFRYPEIAQEMGIQGKVNIMFIIQKDGNIGNVRLRGPDKSLEKEAARIIDKLPKMTPGKQRGKAVKVPFSIPINFKLQ
ncbi:energy transducer TonB [Aurantibacter sp.]|uniref:energy transducer TonB n=1 Tax=Aurantibacter sp. TaxID=2807103 RepID=UPI003267DB70